MNSPLETWVWTCGACQVSDTVEIDPTQDVWTIRRVIYDAHTAKSPACKTASDRTMRVEKLPV